MKLKIALFMLIISAIGHTQEINIKVGATNYLTGSTYTFANTVSGNSSTVITFTIENTLAASTLNLTGPPIVDLDGTDAAMFVVNEVTTSTTLTNVSHTTFTITFSPTSAGAKTAQFTILSNDADESSYVVNLTGTGTVNNTSAIIITPSYLYPQNVAYQNYQASDITNTGNDIEIGSFTLRDGNGTNDADNLGTTLTDITFSLSNFANIRSVALYDGITEVGTDENGGAAVTFNGLNLTAPDNSTKIFTIRISYNDAVTDNLIPQFAITSATALVTGSTFTYSHSGTGAATTTSARTSVTGNDNKIEVTATKLAFVQGANDVDTFIAMSPSVTVEAVDTLDNRDLDYTTAVVLATTGTYNTGAAPINDANNNAVAGLATYPLIVHSLAGTGLTLTASSGVLTTAVSNTFDIGPASAANNYFRSFTSGDWDDPASWESSGDNTNWTASTLKPTNVSSGIRILNGHTITCNTTENGDQMIIDSGGTFIIDTGGVFTLSNGSGTDLTANGTFTYADGTFTKVGTIAFGATGIYNHAISTSTLTLPIAAWNAASICNVTGLNNATAIVGTNMNQTFGIFNWNNPNQIGYVAVNHASFKVATTLNIGTTTANTNNVLCLTDSGTFTNLIKTININGGKLIAASGTGNSTITISGVTTVAGGELIGSQGSGTATINTNTTFNISAGNFILINDASSGNVNFTLSATNRDLTISGTGALLLENVSSAIGVATLTLNRSFICSSTTTPAVDFGTGTATDNAINIKGNLTKTNNGTFTTTSSNPAKGFVFFNTGAQALSYAGTNSSSVNYTVNSGSQLTMSTGLTFGNAAGPESVFTVKTGGRINLGTTVITGNATLAQFIAETGSTISSSSTGGLGGTVATGNFQSFGSVNTTPATGRVSLPAGINYILSGSTTTPFPVAGGGVFGDPATITTSGNITSNMTSALTVTSAFTVSANTFKLNTASNDLILNNAVLTITGNFDNNGENQILNGGGSPAININGKFLTRDIQGFVGASTAIPTITPALGASSTVEYALTGNQTVQGSPAYKNLTFSGSGTKTLDSNTAVSTKITVTSPAIFDTQTFTAGGTGTALTMTGTAQYKTSGTGVKPDATGTYTLAAGSFIEFNGTQPIEIRLGSPAITYGKIVINGSDVSNNSTTTGIKLQTGGAFTVNNGGVFKFKNTDGFTGSTSTAINNVPTITPVLNTGSTIEYAGDSQFITPLATTPATAYYKKLTISGTGIKTIPGTGEIFVSDNLTVTSSTLQIDSERLLTVTNGINNSGGTIDIKNKGNLVQITNGISNTGNINMTRTTRVMNHNDYVYWGQPVQENVLSQIPMTFNASYMWNINGSYNGSWGNITSTSPGTGFITRVGNNGGAQTYDFVFTGVANNGTVAVTGINSFDNGATLAASGNAFLLGNPYPSAINAATLVSANSTMLSGTLYFWTALTPINNNAYSTNDYASWNATGGVGTKATSDISGTDDLKPTGKIAAGQGFFAKIKGDGTINFTNAMRLRTTTDNGQFFKPGPTEVDQNVVNHKIWLNLTNSDNAFRQMLVGYISGATNEVDDSFDGDTFTANTINIYSINGDRNLVIQGRALPFVDTDLVPIGYKVATEGTYTIAIDEMEGVFNETQDVFLEDLSLNVIHDLKESNYNFTTVAGTFDNRFILRYTGNALGNGDFETANNTIFVASNKNQLTVRSLLDNIEGITVFDLLGRKVFEQKNIHNTTFNTREIVMNQQALIVKVQLENGRVVTKKIIH